MINPYLSIFLLLTLIGISACTETPATPPPPTVEPEVSIQAERAAILATLNNETKAAFRRDYEGWTQYWMHDPGITKTYLDFSENSFSESVGWEEISGFVKAFIEEHPEPEPVPRLLEDISVRLYGTGAWVSYEQQDSLRGLKRETRLMEKVDGQWRIAGMQTTIYGFSRPE